VRHEGALIVRHLVDHPELVVIDQSKRERRHTSCRFREVGQIIGRAAAPLEPPGPGGCRQTGPPGDARLRV
jgi:hypothetical protein